MNSYVFLAFVLYFAILLTIGLSAKKKHLTEADFVIGNRSLNFWVTALSAHAADMSAWLFMAFPAAVFLGGLSQIWIALGLLLGMFCNWQFVAPKLRTETEKFHSYTLSTYFEKRFHDTSGHLRTLTAVMSIFFFACYLSAGLIAMGNMFESLFHINYYIGITIATTVVVIYTFSGGFITVAWTDLFQATFLLLMILLVPAVAYFRMEGASAIFTNAQHSHIPLVFFEECSVSCFLGILFLTLGWGLGYFGQPHIITKFMGIRDPNELYKSKYVGMTWQCIALIAAASVGLVGIGFFPDGLNNSELVFVEMVKALFHPFVMGFILCGVIAANMSTMDSQILVSATVLTEDIYKHLFRKTASSRELLKTSRICVVLVALVAFILACSKSSTVAGTVFYAWAGLGCTFGPLILMALYSKKANKYGAFVGVLVGGLMAGVWHRLNPFVTSMPVPAMVPGFFLSVLSIYAVSALTSKE